MKYAKVDTTLRDHPKALTAGPLAMGVWLGALLYCRDQLTDGFVPDAAIPTFFGGGVSCTRAAAKLVAIGLFSRTEGGYLLTGYADKNDTKATVTAAIEKKQKSQKKWKENTKREAGENREILSPHSHSHSHSLLSESGEGEPEREPPIAAEDLPKIAPKRRDPQNLPAHDRYGDAYAEGQKLAVPGSVFQRPAESWDVRALVAFVTTPGWGGGLEGEPLLEAIRQVSASYRRACNGDGFHIKKGFPPEMCLKWAQGAEWRRPKTPQPRALVAPRTLPDEPAYVPAPGEAAAVLAAVGRGGSR